MRYGATILGLLQIMFLMVDFWDGIQTNLIGSLIS